MLRRKIPLSFRPTVLAFANALRLNSRRAFVFVGGSAATFGYGPGYDASVAQVIEVLREEGIGCNDAPETHGMPLAADGIHFDSECIPRLVGMWKDAIRSAAGGSSRLFVLPGVPCVPTYDRVCACLLAHFRAACGWSYEHLCACFVGASWDGLQSVVMLILVLVCGSLVTL